MAETGYKIRNQEAIYFVTFSVVYWIDIFTRQRYRDILIDNLRYCQQNKNLIIYAYVMMSNHAHFILKSATGNLSGTIKDFKSFTSKTIIDAVKSEAESRRKWLLFMFSEAAKKHKRNMDYQVWTHDNHPEELESNHFLEQKLEYIHYNPVRAGIVEQPYEYVYSSAKIYTGEKGLLDVEFIQ